MIFLFNFLFENDDDNENSNDNNNNNNCLNLISEIKDNIISVLITRKKRFLNLLKI